MEGAVAEHRWEFGGAALEEFLLCDVEDNTRRTEVLLHACVDEVIGGKVPRAREDVGGHIGNEGDAVRLRRVVVLRAVDGVVEAEVEVGGMRENVEFVLTWDADVVLLLGRGGDGADAEFYGLLVCLFGK